MICIMLCLLIATAGFIFTAPMNKRRTNVSVSENGKINATSGVSSFAGSGRGNTSTLAAPGILSDVSQSARAVLRLPPRRIAWGAYAGDTIASAPLFETLVGRKMDLQPIFVGWNDPFPGEYAPTVRDDNKTLVIFWEQYGVTLDQIVSGDTDAYITEFAHAARLYGGKIILAPLHEMNGNWDPWDGTAEGNTPAKVVNAWRHIHDLFHDAHNVQFAWAVNNGSVPDTPENAIALYYPGDAYTDYVAVDGFNDGKPWRSWSESFESTLKELSVYHKPIYILSMSSAAGKAKAAWITDALTVEIPKHPEIVGWIWFNENKEQHWSVESDAESLNAFKNGLPK